MGLVEFGSVALLSNFLSLLPQNVTMDGAEPAFRGVLV